MAAGSAPVFSRGVLTYPFNERHCPVLRGENRYTVVKAGDGSTYIRIFLDQLDEHEFRSKSLEVANIAVGVFTLYFGKEYARPGCLTDKVVPLPGEIEQPGATPLIVRPSLFTSTGS